MAESTYSGYERAPPPSNPETHLVPQAPHASSSVSPYGFAGQPSTKKLYFNLSYFGTAHEPDASSQETESETDEHHPLSEEEITANALLSSIESNKDWNKEFQEILEAPDNVSKFRRLRHLANDFLYVATICTKIIISELYSPKKTIPSITIGGRAGGHKYVYRNILFKLATDTELGNGTYMYGGDQPSTEKAMKAASHELKGLMLYAAQRIEGIHFPMVVMIDYKGYRVIAQSLLPINKSTIVYGSADGGETIHADMSVINEKIEKIGKRLNLAPHLMQNKTIYGPGDQEVHLGTDNRFYVIDLARVFPCEAPPKTAPKGSFDPRSVFYHLLRPEFVIKYHRPLVSDVYTGWGKKDPNYLSHNEAVYEATQHLYTRVIPQFAKELDAIDATFAATVDLRSLFKSIDLIGALHRAGINVRHMGKVRSLIRSERMRSLLLMEMISRVIKNMIREEMRTNMKKIKYLSSEDVKDIIISYFNTLIAETSSTSQVSDSTAQGAYNQSLLPTIMHRYSLRHVSSIHDISPTRHDPDNWKKTSAISLHSSTESRCANVWTTFHLDDEFKRKLLTQFRDALSPHERQTSFSLNTSIPSVSFILWRLCQQLGIEMSNDALQEFLSSTGAFEFVHCDIVQVHPKVRFMNIIEEAEGMELMLTALEKPKDRRFRLLNIACAKFGEAWANLPDNFQSLAYHARALFELSQLPACASQQSKLLTQALQKIEESIRINDQVLDSQRLYITVLLKTVQTIPSDSLLNSISIFLPRMLYQCVDFLEPTLQWSERMLTTAESTNYTLLSCVGQVLVSIHQTTSLLFGNKETNMHLSEEKLRKIHLKALLTLANVRILQSNSAPTTPKYSRAEAIKNAAQKQRHVFQAAEKFCEAIEWFLQCYKLYSKSVPKYDSTAVSVNSIHKIVSLNQPLLDTSPLYGDAGIASQMLGEILGCFPAIIRLAANSHTLNGYVTQLFPLVMSVALRDSHADSILQAASPQLCNLVQLDISHTQVSASTLRTVLPQLISLQSLDVTKVISFDDSALYLVSKHLSRLVAISLSGTSITSNSFSFFISFCSSRLLSLNIAGCSINHREIQRSSSHWSKLIALNASSMLGTLPMWDRDYIHLYLPTSLQSLYLFDCLALSNETIHGITALGQLTDLGIGSVTITDANVRSLASIATQLQSLSLKGITAAGSSFVPLLESLHKLSYLSMRACRGLNDDHLMAFSSSNVYLRSLSLSSCALITGVCFDRFTNITGLTELELSFMGGLHAESIAAFVAKQQNLRTFKANATQRIDDAFVLTVANGCKLLTDVSLESLRNITDKTSEILATHCTNLTSLSLAGCKKLTNKTLAYLASARSLKYLNLQHCKQLTSQEIEHLCHTLELLRVVH